MGYIIERANILDRLFFSLQIGLRFLPGSMAVAVVMMGGRLAQGGGRTQAPVGEVKDEVIRAVG
jgi:TRAP-type mannitol/chloroaromatic compound transport system permease large subunit